MNLKSMQKKTITTSGNRGLIIITVHSKMSFCHGSIDTECSTESVLKTAGTTKSEADRTQFAGVKEKLSGPWPF